MELTTFPNIGNILILIGVSTVMLLSVMLLFENMETTLLDIPRILKECATSSKNVENSIDQSPYIDYNMLSKLNSQNGGGLIDDNTGIIYKSITTFYAALIIITFTIYLYKYFFDNKKDLLTDGPIVWGILAIITIAGCFYALYKLKNYEIIKKYSILIMCGIILFFVFIQMYQLHTLYSQNWMTYVYPFGVLFTVLINEYIISHYNLSFATHSTILFILAGIFVFTPYTIATF